MKLEEIQTMPQLDKFIETLPAKIGKPMLSQLLQKALVINSTILSQALSQGFRQLTYSAWCEGKTGTQEEINKSFNEWLKIKMAVPPTSTIKENCA